MAITREVVQSEFNRLLGRSASEAEVASRIAQNAGNLAGEIMKSDEYMKRQAKPPTAAPANPFSVPTSIPTQLPGIPNLQPKPAPLTNQQIPYAPGYSSSTPTVPYAPGYTPQQQTPQYQAPQYQAPQQPQDNTQAIAGFYREYLGREGRPDEIAYWNKTQPNLDTIRQGFLASDEYKRRQSQPQQAQAAPVAPITTAPVAAQPAQTAAAQTPQQSWIQKVNEDNALRMAQAQEAYRKSLESIKGIPSKYNTEDLRKQALTANQTAAQLAQQQRMTLLGIQDNPNLTMSQIVGQQGQARQVLGAQLEGAADLAKVQQMDYENAVKESQYQQNLEAEIAKTQYNFQRDLLDSEKAALANELAIAEMTGTFRGEPTFQALNQDFKNILDIAGLTGEYNGAPTLEAKKAVWANAQNIAQNAIAAFNAETAAGKAAGGAGLTDTAIAVKTDLEKGLSQLDSLTQAITSAVGLMGPAVGPLRSLNPYDTGYKELQAQIDLARQIVGKALEGGVLRKEDEAKYTKILPTTKDTPQQAINKIEQLKRELQSNLKIYLENQQSYGKSGQSFNLGGTQAPGSNRKLSNVMFQNLGSITGIDGSPYWRAGLDIDLRSGTEIKSPVAGKVLAVVPASQSGGFGNQVQVQDANGNVLWFSHLSKANVKAGDKVTKGQPLALGGNTGNVIAGATNDGSHLDLTILRAGKKPDYSNKGANPSFYSAREVVDYLEKYA